VLKIHKVFDWWDCKKSLKDDETLVGAIFNTLVEMLKRVNKNIIALH